MNDGQKGDVKLKVVTTLHDGSFGRASLDPRKEGLCVRTTWILRPPAPARPLASAGGVALLRRDNREKGFQLGVDYIRYQKRCPLPSVLPFISISGIKNVWDGTIPIWFVVWRK